MHKVKLAISRPVFLVTSLSLFMMCNYSFAGAQRVGSWEWSIDTPWRISPNVNNGHRDTLIPINLSIMDSNIKYYTPECSYLAADLSDCGNKPPKKINSITVIERDAYNKAKLNEKIYSVSDVTSIEATYGYWNEENPGILYHGKAAYTSPNSGLSGNNGGPGARTACINGNVQGSYRACSVGDWSTIQESSEFHLVLGYKPVRNATGSKVFLEVVVNMTFEDGNTDNIKAKLLTTLAIEELPKFDDNYAYGDLHYHSQGTDNAGEWGYSFRETYHAASHLGLDWILISDHANNTKQLSYVRAGALSLLGGILTTAPTYYFLSSDQIFWALSDMSEERWTDAWHLLNSTEDTADIPLGILKNGENTLPSIRSVKNSGEVRDPLLILGGEVDFIPEIKNDGRESHYYDFRTGVTEPYTYNISNACFNIPTGTEGRMIKNIAVDATTNLPIDDQLDKANTNPLSFEIPWVPGSSYFTLDGITSSDIPAICRPHQTLKPFANDPSWSAIRDPQGDLGMVNSRQHMIHIPSSTDAAGSDKFSVISNTTQTGGATRRLKDIIKTEYEEKGKGYGFLAHPQVMESKNRAFFDRSREVGAGVLGPDIVPLHMSQLFEALKSEYILGAQAWNENETMETKVSTTNNTVFYNKCLNGNHTIGRDIIVAGTSNSYSHYMDGDNFYRDNLNHLDSLYDANGNTKMCGTLTAGYSYRSILDTITGLGDSDVYGHKTQTVERWRANLAGFLLVDEVNLLGLKSSNHKMNFPWLSQTNEPRKFFIAGGSDSHGDFSQRQVGYAFGLEKVINSAIGTPRNLVFTGEKDGDFKSINGVTSQQYSWNQILSGLKSGNFSVSSGPALRIAIDTNHNRIIDDQDIPMGSTFELPQGIKLADQTVVVLVEWKSTDDFGPVQGINLWVGTGYSGGVTKLWGPHGDLDMDAKLLQVGDSPKDSRFGKGGEWQTGATPDSANRWLYTKDYYGKYVKTYNYRQYQAKPLDFGSGSTPLKVYSTSKQPLNAPYMTTGNEGTQAFFLKMSDFEHWSHTQTVFNDVTNTSYKVPMGISKPINAFIRAEVYTQWNKSWDRQLPYWQHQIGVSTSNPVWVVQNGWKN